MKNDICFSVDSTTPLTKAQMEAFNIISTPLNYTLDGKEYEDIFKDDVDKQSFYEKLKNGAIAKSSQVYPEAFINKWRPILAQGKKILHFSLSAKVSGTYDSACFAKGLLEKQYPDKINVVDTHIGGYDNTKIVLQAAEMYNKGLSVEDIMTWISEANLRYNLIFTVDDIGHLHRGGRISHFKSIIGSVLKLKPIIYVSNEGKLEFLHNSRGLKKAMAFIVNKIEANATDRTNWIHISHGGDEGNALILVDKIREKLKFIKRIDISVLSPVLGLHAGPGSLAVFYEGNNRNDILK